MEKEHSSFSKTGNMLSRASNSLKPGPWEISPEALMFEAWNMVGRASLSVLRPAVCLVCNVLEILLCSPSATPFD